MKISHPAVRILLPAVMRATLSLSACAGMGGDRSQRIAEKAQQRFAAADLDHDGSLGRAEASQGMPRLAQHFDEIDTDHDDQLSKAEIVAYLKQRRASR
jgi:Ca2+-binding EF-hand superfamily protein